jgi:hypothetical protein
VTARREGPPRRFQFQSFSDRAAAIWFPFVVKVTNVIVGHKLIKLAAESRWQHRNYQTG